MTTPIPDSQQEIYNARLDGIEAEYDIREGLVDTSTLAKVQGSELDIKLTTINADNEVQLNRDGNIDKIELAKIGLDSDREIAVIRGEQKVDLAELGAELGLEREVIVGKADHDGKILVAENQAEIDAELALQRGEFKQDYAVIDGEFRVEIAELNAGSKKAVSDVRIAGMDSASEIKIAGIGREASIEADSITTRSATTINIGDASTSATQESLALTGQTTDAINLQDAEQQVTFSGAESEQKILTDRALLEQKLANDSAKTVIEVTSIATESAQDSSFILLESEQKISNDVIQTTAEIDGKSTVTGIEIDYSDDISNVKVSGIQSDAAARAINIGTIVDLDTSNDRVIESIENSATLQAAQLDSDTDSILAEIESTGDFADTQAKINNIQNVSNTRSANTITIAQAQALVDLHAAEQSGRFIESQTVIREGDIRVSAENNVQRIIDMSELSISAIINDAISLANSAIDGSNVGASYAEAVADYINNLSIETSNRKLWFDNIIAQANRTKASYRYTIDNDGATPPSLPRIGFDPVSLPQPPSFDVPDIPLSSPPHGLL